MTKRLLFIALLCGLASCAQNPYAKTATQSGSCSASSGTSATFSLTVTNLPSGTSSGNLAGTLTDSGGQATTLTANASSTGGLLTGTVAPGMTYDVVLSNNGAQFFKGTLSFSSDACAYNASVDYQSGSVTNGG